MLCDPVFETKMEVILVTFLVLTVGLPYANTGITFSGFTNKEQLLYFALESQRSDGTISYYALKDYT